MTTVLTVIGCTLLVASIFCFWGVTPDVMMGDLMDMLRPSSKLRIQAENIQNNKPRADLYAKLQKLRNSMEASGKGKYFPLLFTASGLLVFLGIAIAAWLKNWFLAPTLVVALGTLPMTYASNVIREYEKSIRDEMETALSVITNAYLRMDDITAAIKETITYVKPPMRQLFEKYLVDVAINPAKKEALYRLRSRLDDQIWFEWVTTLIQCQDDRSLRENLQPIVEKLTDVRLVNDQVKGDIASARSEYFAVAAFLFVNYPMMYAINPDGFQMLIETTVGKAITGFVAAAVLITCFIMQKVTQDVTFDK